MANFLTILIFLLYCVGAYYAVNIIEDRKHKVTIVKAVLCALAVDDEATDEEIALLKEICEKMGVSQRKLNGLIREIRHGNSSVYISSYIPDRKEVLSYVAKMILVDGEIGQEERRLYNRLGKMYEVNQEELKDILEEAKKSQNSQS